MFAAALPSPSHAPVEREAKTKLQEDRCPTMGRDADIGEGCGEYAKGDIMGLSFPTPVRTIAKFSCRDRRDAPNTQISKHQKSTNSIFGDQ